MSSNKEREAKKITNPADMGKPEVREQILGDGLPDLDKIEVPILTGEEKAKAEEQYQRRRTFAERAGEKSASINREIAAMEADREKLDLSPILQGQLARLKAAREKLLVEDAGVKSHTEFATFVAEIRQAKPEETQKYVTGAAAKGRIRLTERTTGTNLLFWAGRVYEPSPDSTGKITSGTLGLVNELRKLVDAAKTARRDAYREAIAAMKAKATAGLTLSRAIPGTKGLVYGYLPQKEEKNPTTGEIRRTGESHFLVEYTGREIKPVEAVGRLGNFFAELKTAGRSILIRDLQEGRLTGGHLSEEAFKQTRGFLGILLTAKHLEQEAAAKAAAAKKPAPPVAEEVAEIGPLTFTPDVVTQPAPKKRAPRVKKTEAAA